jgi:hypothetical protein
VSVSGLPKVLTKRAISAREVSALRARRSPSPIAVLLWSSITEGQRVSEDVFDGVVSESPVASEEVLFFAIEESSCVLAFLSRCRKASGFTGIGMIVPSRRRLSGRASHSSCDARSTNPPFWTPCRALSPARIIAS